VGRILHLFVSIRSILILKNRCNVPHFLGFLQSSCLLLSIYKQGHLFGFISLLCFFGFVVLDITYHFVVPRNKHNWIIYINKSLWAKTLLKVGNNLIASCAPLLLQCYCLHVLPYTLSLKWDRLIFFTWNRKAQCPYLIRNFYF
jgi:hypothetical protein